MCQPYPSFSSKKNYDVQFTLLQGHYYLRDTETVSTSLTLDFLMNHGHQSVAEKKNTTPLENDGWKTSLSFWGV